jgi:hypothetical protein
MDPPWATQLGWSLAAWSLVYWADYVSTIASARLYRQAAHEHIVFEGSLELTPTFQHDVDRLRWVSPRFLFAWALSLLGLSVIWWLSVAFLGWVQPMQFVLGALLLREAAVLLRHARNLLLFHRVSHDDGLDGQVRYQRGLMLYLSGGELLSFSLVYAVLGLALSSWFMAGGAVATAVTGWQHWRWSRSADGSRGSPSD